MCKLRWLLALPLALAASVGSAGASSIRDHAGMFDPDIVRQAEAKLNEVERDSGLTTTIETIDSLNGESLDAVAEQHAQRSGTEGMYILIPKKEHRFRALVSRPFRATMTEPREEAIKAAFVSGFKSGDFDAGLKAGVMTIAREVSAARAASGGALRQNAPAAAPGRPGVPARGRAIPQPKPAFGLSSLLGIGLLIIAVLFGIRLLGSLFGGRRGGYAGPGRMGPGYGGPGYGGPGYGGGGGGGGFFSNMLGGLGGAVAGNWLYDQFSGRHHQGGGYMDSSSTGMGGDPGQDAGGGGDWSGGGGVSGDWGGGGGDAGGGGDWGGGAGGDWGGGGGDGGGGGGGDW